MNAAPKTLRHLSDLEEAGLTLTEKRAAQSAAKPREEHRVGHDRSRGRAELQARRPIFVEALQHSTVGDDSTAAWKPAPNRSHSGEHTGAPQPSAA